MCKAQVVYPISTFSTDIPAGSYIKDLNNDLDNFVGIYVATFNGNFIYLNIGKEVKKTLNKKSNFVYYRDQLVITYEVKNGLGQILQSTLVTNSNINKIYSIYFNKIDNIMMMHYIGTNCSVGWGTIELKKINGFQLNWTYYPNSSVLTNINCPGNPDTNVYLPATENLIFTKQ